jgi:biopolymer transport protein ExbB
MKKLLILTACFSMAFAEEPASEMQAKQEIESFLTEEPTPEVQLSSSTLPVSEAPAEEVITTQEVELSTETPVMHETLAAPASELTTTPSIVPQILQDPEADIAAIEKEEQEVAAEVRSEGIDIDLGQVFSGSPTIYTILLFLSIASLAIGVYAFVSLRTLELIPAEPVKEIRAKLMGKQYDEALNLCSQNPSILFRMVACGIQARYQGTTTMMDLMKAEGKRASSRLWQKISLLNEIAVIAPMLGLLGTVLGMFYAFYDLNRSMESISTLFDGLGISVGTTVGGLVVAIIALLFHMMTKYRLMRQLTLIENEASSLATLIDTQGKV